MKIARIECPDIGTSTLHEYSPRIFVLPFCGIRVGIYGSVICDVVDLSFLSARGIFFFFLCYFVIARNTTDCV